MADIRQELIDFARLMGRAGLNRGTAGNLSVRKGHGFWITPTGLDYDTLTPDDIVFVNSDGSSTGMRQPSSEWRFHHDLYLARPEAGAVLHAHSPCATALACLRREIPPFHYMIARFGGDTVRCADYASFGTQQLSDNALQAMSGRNACLLANHGLLVFGRSLKQTFDLGVELEALCEQYVLARQVGEPVLLDAAEMQLMLEKFRSYGQQRTS